MNRMMANPLKLIIHIIKLIKYRQQINKMLKTIIHKLKLKKAKEIIAIM